MTFEIQFVRFTEGETWPAILQKMEVDCSTQGQAEDQAALIYGATATINHANGWQVAENGGAIVAQWRDPHQLS